MRTRIGSSMSTPEAPIPTKFWAAVRWTVENHPWIFFLVAVERLAERHFDMAAIFAAIFVGDLFIASRWDAFGSYLQRRKWMLPYIALGALGLLLVGIAIGGLWTRDLNMGSAQPNTGRLVWNFDDPVKRTTDYILVMAASGPKSIRVGGFQATGKNKTADPVTQFKGYIRVDRTNRTDPIYIVAGEEKSKGPFDNIIPTLPEETYGIPGLAEFKIQTFEKVFFETGKDGVPSDEFVRDYVPFTLVLEYDGIKVERKFSKQDIEAELKRFEVLADPANSSLNPRIVRKPTAAQPKPDFPPLLDQQSNDQNRASPIAI
jgi:hypothetical protein